MLNSIRQKFSPHTKLYKKGTYKLDLTCGPFLKKIIKFSFPLAVMIFFQLLFNAADLAIIGRFEGKTAFSAVGATGSVTQLLVNLFMGLSIGTNIVVAKYIGNQNDEKVSNAVHTSILASIILGIISSIIGIIFCRPLLILMNCKDDLLSLATIYLKYYFIGMPFSLLYNYGAAVLRAMGDTKRPLYFLTLSGVLNIILNVIFVVFFKLSVKGVAIATVISQAFSSILVVICLLKIEGPCKLQLKKLKINFKSLGKIIYIGIPAGIQGICFNITNIIAQSNIILLGENVVSGFAATASLSAFISVITASLYNCAVAFAAQNYGAKKLDNIKKLYLYLQGTCLCLTCIVTGGFLLFKNPLLSIYIEDSEVLTIANNMFLINATFYFVWGISEISIGFIRGLNYSIGTMIISVFGICGLRILYFIFIFPINKSYQLLMWVYPISWTVIAILNFLYYLVVYKKTKKKICNFQNEQGIDYNKR